MILAGILDALGLSEVELWGDDRLSRMADRRDGLERQLARRYRALIRQRRAIEGIREQLESRSSTDVDSINRQRARLRECELAYQHTLSEFSDRKRRLADLQQRMRVEKHLAG
jgi:hypothetical protein